MVPNITHSLSKNYKDLSLRKRTMIATKRNRKFLWLTHIECIPPRLTRMRNYKNQIKNRFNIHIPLKKLPDEA